MLSCEFAWNRGQLQGSHVYRMGVQSQFRPG